MEAKMTIKIVTGAMNGFGTIVFVILSIRIIAILRNILICRHMEIIHGQKNGQKMAIK